MISFLYNISLWLLACIAMPKVIYQMVRYGKYRNSLSKRLGSHFPKIAKGGRPLVWIHAGSIGETKAVAALAKKVKSEYNDPILVISSVTETGHAEAKKSLPFADHHVYLPLDFSHIIKPIVKQTKPDLVILAESDFWLNFLKYSKKQGAFIALVNGKISERSAARFAKFPAFTKKLLGLIDCFCVQNTLYADRFLKLFVPQSKIAITGNMKFDEEFSMLSPDQLQIWREQLGLTAADRVLVIGSSHDPEEKLCLDALKTVWEVYPKLKVILVPRHPERFSEVANLISKKAIPFIRFTEIIHKKGNQNLILMDAMGLLRKCYQFAEIAIVAGSYTPKVGGHNIIEPCLFGVLVLFGPNMHTQPELVALVNEFKAGMQVAPDQLAQTLIELLGNREKAQQLGEGGQKLIKAMKGATDKTWKAVVETTK